MVVGGGRKRRSSLHTSCLIKMIGQDRIQRDYVSKTEENSGGVQKKYYFARNDVSLKISTFIMIDENNEILIMKQQKHNYLQTALKM